MIMCTIPLYAKEISGSSSIAGMMISILTFSALLFRPIFGVLADTRGRRLVIVLGAAILMVVSFFYNFAYTIAGLMILRFFNGMGFSAHTTASGTIISDILPANRIAEGIGYFGISNTLATAIGPAIGLYVVKRSGYSLVFIIVFVLSILSLISTLFINYEKKEKNLVL